MGGAGRGFFAQRPAETEDFQAAESRLGFTEQALRADERRAGKFRPHRRRDHGLSETGELRERPSTRPSKPWLVRHL